MIKVAFLHERKSYLPEIDAYERYLNNTDQFEAVIVESIDEIDETFDIVWKVMGIDTKRQTDAALIHEYATITVGKNAKLKDFIKRLINLKPDGRVFQNERVRDEYRFNDAVPYIYRNMGIDSKYFNVTAEKIYDFVYVGTMDPSRQLDRMLSFFKTHPQLSIVMIGTPDEKLFETYGDLPNVTFTGRIDNQELPKIAAQARYGLNYIPDVFPFNEQTSTKLIEYCAMGLDIVTTSYSWVNEFEKEHNGRFFKIDEDLSNLSVDALSQFNFHTPSLEHMEWSRLLDDAKLIDFLLDVYTRHREKDEQ